MKITDLGLTRARSWQIRKAHEGIDEAYLAEWMQAFRALEEGRLEGWRSLMDIAGMLRIKPDTIRRWIKDNPLIRPARWGVAGQIYFHEESEDYRELLSFIRDRVLARGRTVTRRLRDDVHAAAANGERIEAIVQKHRLGPAIIRWILATP